MKRPPRRSNERLFGSGQILIAALQGVVLLAGVLGLYLWLNSSGGGSDIARTAAFIALVTGHICLAAAILIGSGRTLFSPRRWMLLLIAGGAIIVLSLTVTVPALLEIMRFARPGPMELLGSVSVGVVAGGWYAGRLLFASPRVTRTIRTFARVLDPLLTTPVTPK